MIIKTQSFYVLFTSLGDLSFIFCLLILKNHSFSLWPITAIICEFYCPQSCSSILVTRTRSALSHKKWVFCLWISYVLAGSPKKLHFCSDLGRRFDGPGRYRRIGMTGEVCTELRVHQNSNTGREEREHRARGDQECFVTSRWPTNVPILHPIPNCRIAADTLRPGTLAPHTRTLIGVLTRESPIAAPRQFTELHCSAA